MLMNMDKIFYLHWSSRSMYAEALAVLPKEKVTKKEWYKRV